MDNLLQAKNSIINAKNIGILVKNDANDDVIASVLALFFALKNSHKKVSFFDSSLPSKITSILKTGQQKKVHITLDEEVSEVYYEKKDAGIEIFITPKNELFSDDKFSCKIISNTSTEENLLDFDLLFTIGIENFESVESMCKEHLDQLYACNIINIDRNLSNQNYGEVNIIEDKQSISQTVSKIIKSLGDGFINHDILSFLLCGILSDSRNNDLHTIEWLIKNGGDFSVLPKFGKEITPQIKMLEESLKTLNVYEENGLHVSTITESAMIKSKATSRDLAFVVEKMKNIFRLPSFLLLWESHSSPVSVKGIFYSDDKNNVQKINDNFRGISKGMGIMFLTEEVSIDVAKQKVLLQLLKN